MRVILASLQTLVHSAGHSSDSTESLIRLYSLQHDSWMSLVSRLQKMMMQLRSCDDIIAKQLNSISDEPHFHTRCVAPGIPPCTSPRVLRRRLRRSGLNLHNPRLDVNRTHFSH